LHPFPSTITGKGEKLVIFHILVEALPLDLSLNPAPPVKSLV